MIVGGENIKYPAVLHMKLETRKIETKIRNEHTDGKFLTIPEYKRLIRKKKLKKIL